ncbi:TetR/AcrR family transcriptional regulator [Chelatococcus asaccharovorans]|uniref:TetR family transcriptional regulator n=1 Tax=Chelatococcus asaccharovorans TaxID=28210 RepID=A0A2V3TT86_9HYPH|nr:TetR/AcrR family transcriptional regulator [Chelatococcus asaccharovorans]MBS7704931.1 TetR/AcrR family transcriptional regulator [Chelatococcus asaccharovorans]PXW51394.1 TetR family transcriptional regulator [Chelatococcus asaccharovorans]
MAVRRQRRTQQERSADTSERLLNATIDLLHDRGLYRMSTSEIAEAAGLSRGALTHHFSSKEEIIVEAVGYMLRKVTAELHGMAEGIRFSGSSTDEIVEYLWRMMNDRLFYVTMEYLPEARHNAEFRQKIVPVVKEFHEGLNAVWAELAAQAGVGVDQVLVLMNATMCMFRGMIAQTAVKDDPAYFQELLQFWKGQVRREFNAVVASSPALRRAARN